MTCEQHFSDTGFHDLLPLARRIAAEGGYNETDMITAVCMTFDKAQYYPPTWNRRKWFEIVYAEKLAEARAQHIRREWEKRRSIR